MTRVIYDMRSEIKSPEDVLQAEVFLRKILNNYRRTYDFIITSDMQLQKGGHTV